MKKKCKVVMLLTKREAIIYQSKYTTNIGLKIGRKVINGAESIDCSPTFQLPVKDIIAQHLYILSDEEIKEGDWHLESTAIGGLVHQATKESLINWKSNKMLLDNFNRRCKKIIASTDPSLSPFLGFDIESGIDVSNKLPSLSQSFIEEYVSEYNKGNEIEEVMVEYEEYCINNIPKQDHTCVNKDLRIKLNPNNTINIKRVKDSYTKEEVIKLMVDSFNRGVDKKMLDQTWIEDNL